MARCKECEKEISWAETTFGKSIALDEVKDTKKVTETRHGWVMFASGGQIARVRTVVKGKEAWATPADLKLLRPLYVCHWDTCKS